MTGPAQSDDKTDRSPSRSSTTTLEPDAEQQTKTKVPPPYRVMLHNDQVNFFDDVVRHVCRLTPLTLTEAFQRTAEAHHKGRSALLSTHKERAELYAEQFTSVRLTVTIEPDG